LSGTYPRLESLFDENVAQKDDGGLFAGSYAIEGNVKGEMAL
jgi:hypothetical protein